MAPLIQRLMMRSIQPTLGNIKVNGGASGKGPKAGTLNVHFQSPGQPQMLDQDQIQFASDAYNGNVFVHRCVETIADTISGLPFKAGMDPYDPASYDPTAPLAQLLGPASPQAPGGPNPVWSSRIFWSWSIKQYICYGRWVWECELDRDPRSKNAMIINLWPLPAPYVQALPTEGGRQMFDKFWFNPARGGPITLLNSQVFYGWKPAIEDPREPESVLRSARLPIFISTSLDKYMSNLLKNDMVATTMVVSPPFDQPAGRRAFRDQFRAKYTGVDHAGGTVFAEAERDLDDTTGNPLLQIERIAQTAVESSSVEIAEQAKIDVTIALGVPMSLIGNASQRTYANADSEYKNFWTLKALNSIMDLQDNVNTFLAPRVGDEVGWFDLSKVAALQPPPLFAPPMIADIINFGVADAAQVANVLGIPAANTVNAQDTDTVEVGEESSQLGPGGSRAESYRAEWFRRTRGKHFVRHEQYGPTYFRGRLGGVTKAQMIDAYMRFEQRPKNSYNLEESFSLHRYIERPHIDISLTRSDQTIEATAVLKRTARIQETRALAELERRRDASAALVRSIEAQVAKGDQRDSVPALGMGASAGDQGSEPMTRGSLKRPQKCKYCTNQATKAHIWAEGAAYIPTCDGHSKKAIHRIEITNQDEVNDIVPLPQARADIEPGTKVLWAGEGGSLTDDLTDDDVAQIHDETDPAKALTTWDGSPDTFDDWVDANSPTLEAIAATAD